MENRDAWLFVFLLGVLFFNWPLLDAFRDHLPVYLFSSWAGLVLIIAFLAGRNARRPKQGP